MFDEPDSKRRRGTRGGQSSAKKGQQNKADSANAEENKSSAAPVTDTRIVPYDAEAARGQVSDTVMIPYIPPPITIPEDAPKAPSGHVIGQVYFSLTQNQRPYISTAGHQLVWLA